jgi:hypothetical protein
MARLPPREILARTDHRPWPVPASGWVQRQSWVEFPFVHWTVPPDLVRPLVPAELELDLADGVAWVGVIPFRMTGVTLRGMPDLPGFSAFHELNVRTYVTRDGRPGVYFLSLDANQPLAVRIARAWFGLPYWDAEMTSRQDGDVISYASRRTHRGGGEAELRGRYAIGRPLGTAAPGTLERWLCERYALYVVRGGRVLRGDVHHVPWPLHALEVEIERNTMAAPLGLDLAGPPAHALYSPGVDTVVWALRP